MSRRHLTTLSCLAALAGALLVPVAPAAAQSAADMRRENEQLKSRVRDLEAELAAATARIAELERMVLQMNQARPGSATPPLATPEITIDESVPTASPGAMLKALKTSYEETTKDLTAGDTADSRERRAYLRALTAWAKRMNRDLRKPVFWHVTIKRTENEFGRRIHEFTPVDPVTAVELGKAFQASVPRALVRRLDKQLDRGKETFVLKGVVLPKVSVNERRPDAGPFDHPPFIGPYAEFEYGIEITGLNLPEAKKDQDADKKTKSP